MENPYAFQTSGFGIDKKSLYLLRNNFNYNTIPLSEVQSISIKDGKDLKNWWWVLLVGLALLLYAVYDIAMIIGIFNDENTRRIYIERLIIPLLPLLLGIYSVVIALRNTRVMIVETGKRKYYFSLREIIKQQKENDFTGYIQQVYGAVHIQY